MTALKSRFIPWVVGSAILAAFVAYPLTSHKAVADEERNPRIHHALAALRDARHELEDAPHDFKGKKQAAIESIDRAIERLDEIKDW